MDLLFFRRELKCLIPIELKISEFKPEYVGKMQFYLAALDGKIGTHLCLCVPACANLHADRPFYSECDREWL
ncbi:MAG: hypothetical protein COZ07_03035 [Candidatus Infernicultor aquiphilus]|uniref:YhcG PDDEXK nuclease domain-containing protein n=1 Tax=Candidatus Infernicultor aquiphilus TaxID=1805029 RepID=A0A2M7PRF3_9BACT|nr:DUF1016 domain-containing protein [bacterium]PIU25588.1 MAG: hypothetical protein COT11_01935 [Candidatus Atribacteria bacterium CG08_land_8_20_14_0_20_33_29]PIW12117.1 MAG: hypothetical protein COW35_03200 [Candidatus Atribacteria bacterium CG17_big_fil_post_rev_8_21_14_2_50_34_11]PIX34311.1 MAG: hypothetical protein COZ58_04425 [Candidatus Atribacteria bacterium CG_4_8_14_3_um_filter_34_18]PIY33199.1 MAG: hypothetical protein COZ07_03035 [Candidatus Atribacteria bacterium CG_4_10_14_3_um_f